MKPASFDYHEPTSIDDAVALVTEFGDDGKVLAGGQSLVPMLALRLAGFPHLVDINRVSELAGIDDRGDAVAIGAMVRQRSVERDTVIGERLPLLAQATGHIGHFQIRNRGTIGGSLAHADAAAEYPAVALALAASMELRSATGTRAVAAEDFFLGPWTTALEPGELLAHIVFPISPLSVTHGFAEVARRPGDFATAGAALQLEWDDGVVRAGRLAIFGVESRPVSRSVADLGLVGASAETADLKAAVRAATAGLDPVSDIHGDAAYRRALAGVVISRALASALNERRA